MTSTIRSFLAALLFVTPTAFADDDLLSLWQLSGERNQIYLLGSVHLLREQDYPLPAPIESAYQDADVLLMELDLDDLDVNATQVLVNRLARIQDDRTLPEWLGQAVFEEARAKAESAGIDLAQFAAVEPWFAAVSIEQMMLARIGFDTSLGVEAHMVRKATADGKEVLGLETMEQQLGFLDGLSIGAQRSLLLQTLQEATNIGAVMDTLIGAWRSGDVDTLESETLTELEQYPELHDTLVVKRNADWAQQIVALLDDDSDYLIIVGALHLVGDDSVLVLLERQGHAARQLSDPVLGQR